MMLVLFTNRKSHTGYIGLYGSVNVNVTMLTLSIVDSYKRIIA